MTDEERKEYHRQIVKDNKEAVMEAARELADAVGQDTEAAPLLLVAALIDAVKRLERSEFNLKYA